MPSDADRRHHPDIGEWIGPMKRLTRAATVAVAGLAMATMAVSLPSASGASAANPTPTAQARAVTDAVTSAQGLNATASKCLLQANKTAVAQAPATDTWQVTEYQLAFVIDPQLIGQGQPCSNGGVMATTSTTPGAVEGGGKSASNTGHAAQAAPAGCYKGPFSSWWNVNAHFTSAWMFSHWLGYACYSVQYPGQPQCSPGDSAPNYSVHINNCYTVSGPGSGAPFVTVNRINFTMHFALLWVSEDWSYQYWENDYFNGQVEHGCNAC